MNSHSIPSHFKNFNSTLLVGALLAVSIASLCGVGIVSGTAQSTQKEGRELEDKIPKHLPIKVAVKNLNNEKWARDVEVEITNTGDKPIYYLGVTVVLPGVLTENNHKLGFPLQYGRGNLIDYTVPLAPDDVPIKPGESYTFKIPERLQQGWEDFVKRRGVPQHEPKKVRLVFKSLNFGDGTGFGTVDGLPVAIPQKQMSASCAGDEKKGENSTSILNEPPNRSPDSSFQSSILFLPVGFLPVKFFLAKTSTLPSNASAVRPDVCCPGTICSRLKLRKVNCCGEIDKAFSATCNEGGSFCAILGETTDIFCDGGGGTYCEEDSLVPLCSSPTPTPSPTPPPTPCPTPPDSTQPNETCYRFGPACAQTWQCASCAEGQLPVNYPTYGSYGCPNGYYNNGSYCCVPVAPTPTPTPTPDGGGGGETWCDPYCRGEARNGQWERPQFVRAAFAPGGMFNVDGCCLSTPILIDVRGDGFALTDAAGGVSFDFNGDARRGRISWTAAGADDAWLVLDRNGNGTIDNGAELFGNVTPQADSGRRNGFLALAEYDRRANGGNDDRTINGSDEIYASLRLWQDANHDGLSQREELHPLAALQVARIELDYREARRRDRYDNEFRYRAKVSGAEGTRLGRWAYDVLLVSAQ